jgi:diguanylate cyclase (GGDEF)-like protein
MNAFDNGFRPEWVCRMTKQAERSACAVLVLYRDGDPTLVADGPRVAANGARTRIGRMLRRTALLLSARNDRVAGWALAGPVLAVLVRVPEADGSGGPSVEIDRLLRALRETAAETFASFRLPAGETGWGAIRCGAAQVDVPPAAAADGSALAEALMSAWSRALIQAASPVRLDARRRAGGRSGTLSDLAEPVTSFDRKTPVSEIARHFESHKKASAFVIVDRGQPVGLLMKEKLNQILAWQFGRPLYWNRTVDWIMDAKPLIVEGSASVDEVSSVAMAREPDKLYDAIIVTSGGRVAGIVSIRSMLEWITNARMADAQWANPLTGLPGNEPIRRELTRRLEEGRPFAILYADLDHFKWYNDEYGFQRGDDIIRYTAETLLAVACAHCPEDGFVGHIGGDDYIVLTSGGNPVQMAQHMLARFERYLPSPVACSEESASAPRLSLSLALLLCESAEGWTPERLAERSARLKKQAKSKPGNALVWEKLGGFTGGVH